MLDISLLGPFAARVKERPLTQLTAQKAQALLIYLVVEARQVHQRDALMTLLWPDYPQTSARQSLRQHLYLLRQAIELEESATSLILSEQKTIRLNPDATIAVDVVQFEQLAGNGRTPQEWQQAVELYRGDFLSDFYLPDSDPFEEWAAGRRAFYQRRMQELLQRLVDHYLEVGDYAAAETAVRRQLSLDNLQEAAHRQLIEILAQNGRRQEALSHYDNLRQLLQDELAIEPDAHTLSLVESIRTGSLVSVPTDPITSRAEQQFPSHNLPHLLTSFIGREKELAEIGGLVSNHRLVTLTGVGGIGKTTLAVQAGHQLLATFPDGVWLVELAPVADPEHVAQTAVYALGLRNLSQRPSLELLLDYVQKKECLLILDNCEHLIQAAAQFTHTVLQACPGLKILATSREIFDLPAETTYSVPPLSLPDEQLLPTLAQWSQYEAMRLFVDRAATVLPEFQVTDKNLGSLYQICQRLDGIPLALELAAARVKVLTTAQIATRLDDRFRLLTGGNRSALPRQQTLRALVDWSWELLTEAEQLLLQRLSVFAGGMSLTAVEAVCTDDTLDVLDLLDLLNGLVNKSLLIVHHEQGQERRYRLLETIRQYAQEKLASTGFSAPIQDRHLAYYVHLAEQQAEVALEGPNQAAWSATLEKELDNIRAALNWAYTTDDFVAGLGLAADLRVFWITSGHIREGEDWLARLLAKAKIADTAINATAFLAQSDLLHLMNKQKQSYPLAQKSLALFRKSGNQKGAAVALRLLAYLTWEFDILEARRLSQESLAIFRAIGNKPEIALSLRLLGYGLEGHTFKNFALAYAYLEESKSLYEELDDVLGTVIVKLDFGILALMQEDYDTALSLLEEAMTMRKHMGPDALLYVLSSHARLYYELGRYEEARDYFEKCLSIYDQIGWVNEKKFTNARLGRVYFRLGEFAQAQTIFLQCLQDFNEMGWAIGIAFSLESLAILATYREQPEKAVKLLGWANAAREAIHDLLPPHEQTEINKIITAIQDMIDEETFATAYAAGQAMTMEEAIALAVEDQG